MDPRLLDDLRSLAAQAQSGRLPAVRALAARWRVSPRTAHGVVKAGVAQGWLETRPGGGIWAQGQMPTDREPRSRRYAESIADALRESLRAGQWAAGERLPSPKDMAAQKQVHVITLRKALRRLADEGLLERQGQAWRVSRPRLRESARPTLLCLGAMDAAGKLQVDSDREWEFWREIHAEATRNGLRVEVRPWNFWMDDKPKRGAAPLGAVVSTWHIPNPLPLLKYLHRERLPSAVWLENPLLLSGRSPFVSPWLGYHDLAYSGESGALLARHALMHSHRRIAWISPFHGAEWSRNRLQGLRNHLPAHVELFEALGPWVSEWDMGTGHAETGRRRLFKRFDKVLEQAWGAQASLWVAASDAVAIHCLEWLRRRGYRVPEHLALASFDDTREALRLGLTSVRFDVDAMARAMLRQLLMPGGSRRRFTRYEGMVIVRASTP